MVYVGTLPSRSGVKVGYSSNPVRRARTIGEDGEVFTLLHSELVERAPQIENAAHWELREKHIRGEWFAATLDEAKAAIRAAIDNVANGVHPPIRVGINKPFSAEALDVRLQLVISPSELEALDEWRAKHKIWSRSDAIRRLIAEGVKKR